MVKELRLRELHHVLGLIRVARPDVSKGILIVFHWCQVSSGRIIDGFLINFQQTMSIVDVSNSNMPKNGVFLSLDNE
jgi:hypothetical protein